MRVKDTEARKKGERNFSPREKESESIAVDVAAVFPQLTSIYARSIPETTNDNNHHHDDVEYASQTSGYIDL